MRIQDTEQRQPESLQRDKMVAIHTEDVGFSLVVQFLGAGMNLKE